MSAPKLTVKPLFWSLFGAGGMIAAVILPVLIMIFGLLLLFGMWCDANSFYHAISPIAKNFLGLLVLAGTLGLILWHCCHRFYYCLHDMKVPISFMGKVVLYGVAVVGFLATFLCAM